MIATIPHIKGKDLSPDLLHQFNIRPEQTITITIKTESEETLAVNAKKEKGKWGKIADRLRGEAFLTGKSEKVEQLVKEFRSSFEF
ncbi:MAG: hypothetical protein HQK63_16360 [Desulfamplus sp.]|nr:hypothetical protein [Desulfamplus sp.]